MGEYPIARAWRDARSQRIYGGTNEIMKEIIGPVAGVLSRLLQASACCELGDAVGVVAEDLGEHLVGVLAERRAPS